MHLTPSIIADFQAGRLDSFYAEAYAPLLSYAARLLGDRYALLAEDCVQDAIFTSYQHRHGITNGQEWRNYLFRLVHNGAVSVLRHHSAKENYLRQQTDIEEDFTRSMIQQETLDTLFSAIRSLPERLQHLFYLSFEQGLRNAEVAEQLSVTTRAVTKQKARLIELVAAKIKRE